MMVEVAELMEDSKAQEVTQQEYDQKVEEVYPQAREDLVYFLNRCKLEDS